MQQAIQFLGRYELDDEPINVSDVAVVFRASELMEGEVLQRCALKAMSGYKEILNELSSRKSIDSKHVFSVIEIFVDSSVDQKDFDLLSNFAHNINTKIHCRYGITQLINAELESRQEIMDEESSTLCYKKVFPFLLVMELADRSLNDALSRKCVKSNELHLVRKIGTDLANALANLHRNGRIHGDLKPSNVGHVFFSWQLLNFEVSCRIGEPFGTKVRSTGYCPPEVAKVLLTIDDQSAAGDVSRYDNNKSSDKDEHEAEQDSSSLFVAQESYDLWSLGALLFHLSFGKPLLQVDRDDNLTSEDLVVLSKWDRDTSRTFLYQLFHSRHGDTSETASLCNLIAMLLEPDPGLRAKNCRGDSKNEMEMVMRHPFFLMEDETTLESPPTSPPRGRASSSPSKQNGYFSKFSSTRTASTQMDESVVDSSNSTTDRHLLSRRSEQTVLSGDKSAIAADSTCGGTGEGRKASCFWDYFSFPRLCEPKT